MFWLLIALLTGYALYLPVTVQVDIHHERQTSLKVKMNLASVHKTWSVSDLSGTAKQSDLRRKSQMLSLLHRADRARRFLLAHAELLKLDALILLHMDDAAQTALLTGVLRPLAQLPRKKVRICVQPDFYHPCSSAQIRCMFLWRLGTLLLTSVMLLAAYLRQRRSESEA